MEYTEKWKFSACKKTFNNTVNVGRNTETMRIVFAIPVMKAKMFQMRLQVLSISLETSILVFYLTTN